jgi:hypothetical protein
MGENLFSFIIHFLESVLLIQYFAGDDIEQNEMGGACSSYGEGRGVYTVLVGNMGERANGETQL